MIRESSGGLTRRERHAVRALGLIFVSRQLGLYMVLPVLSTYVARLQGATPMLIGLSLGIYGAGQAFLQVPYGYLSDRIGRKRAINLGLLVFVMGSLVGAVAKTAWLIVLARGLQGSGAFSAVTLALIADSTREEVRAQAMGQMGAWIGITIGFSVVIGPTIAGLFGVRLLFLITAIGAVLSIVYLNLAVPTPARETRAEPLRPSDVMATVKRPSLLMVDVGIFLLHTTVTILFVVLPFEFDRIFGNGRAWMALIPAIAIGLGSMFFVTRYIDRHGGIGFFFYLGAIFLGISCLAFTFIGKGGIAVVSGLLLFAVSVAILEPILATLLSRFSDGPARGTASGVYSMAQFFGAFIGGLLGGACLRREGTLFFSLFFVTVVWVVLLVRMPGFRRLYRAVPAGDTAIGPAKAPE
jgi:MFS family permease